MATVDDDSELNVLLREWWSGVLELGEPEEIPTSRIAASIQGVLRQDVMSPTELWRSSVIVRGGRAPRRSTV